MLSHDTQPWRPAFAALLQAPVAVESWPLMSSRAAQMNRTIHPNGLRTSAYFQWRLTTSYGDRYAPRQERVSMGYASSRHSDIYDGLLTVCEGCDHRDMPVIVVAASRAERATGTSERNKALQNVRAALD